VFDVLVQVAHI